MAETKEDALADLDGIVHWVTDWTENGGFWLLTDTRRAVVVIPALVARVRALEEELKALRAERAVIPELPTWQVKEEVLNYLRSLDLTTDYLRWNLTQKEDESWAACEGKHERHRSCDWVPLEELIQRYRK